ncbi:MAG: hypothetical protein LBQ54_09485, partial [Planctomycetaceae bacterium]|nr:hypothetical protein [Planctomycetaceae bacterium]
FSACGGRIRPGKKVRGEKSDPPSSPSREAPAGGWSCRSEAMTRSRWSLVSIGRITFPTEAEGYCDGTARSPLRTITRSRCLLESASGAKKESGGKEDYGFQPA